jgi:hypothetical protein
MAKKSRDDYDDDYIISRRPAKPLKSHNQVSWDKIETVISSKKDKTASFNELSIAVTDHEHGTKSANHPYQFVTYCIRSGWLVRAD